MLPWRGSDTLPHVTPGDLELIDDDMAVLSTSADRFTSEFYATLFELAPDLRPLFATDLAAQRTKLFDELSVLVERAAALAHPGDVHDFEARAGELGRRHEVYGVTATMYDTVERALLGAMYEVVPGFDEQHERSWTRLYRIVAGAMRRS